MRLRAIEFKQHGNTMYLVCLKANLIAEWLRTGRLKVDVWKPTNPDGYQREHNKRRALEFARFVAAKNISPNSILISVRGKDAKKLKYENGFLEIPDDITLYLVDGQHRGWGLVYLVTELRQRCEDFEIPTVIMPVESSYEEAKQFVIINKTQKGVRTDLAERFLQKVSMKEGYASIKEAIAKGALPKAIFSDIDWRPKAVEIADKLNNDPNSPWYGRIRPPNVSQPDATIRQKSFTDSLEPILKHPDFKDLSVDLLVRILNNYWRAISSIIPEAFASPKDYVVQKTTGAFVFHSLFPTVAKYCKDPLTGKYILTYGKLRDILSKIANSEWLRAEEWRVSKRGVPGGRVALMGTSRKTFITLRDILEHELEKRMVAEKEVEKRFEV